jgi:hypothetical protein
MEREVVTFLLALLLDIQKERLSIKLRLYQWIFTVVPSKRSFVFLRINIQGRGLK